MLVAVNVAYFTKRSLPLKYLLPGLLFLVVFQLYTMVFTGVHVVHQLRHRPPRRQAGGDRRHPEHPASCRSRAGTNTPVVPIVKDGTVSMLVIDPDTGEVSIGTNEGVTDVPDGDVQRAAKR